MQVANVMRVRGEREMHDHRLYHGPGRDAIILCEGVAGAGMAQDEATVRHGTTDLFSFQSDSP